MTLQTKLQVDAIRHQNSDDGFFNIKLHNDLYHISIRYVQQNYNKHRRKQDFQPHDILITVKEISPLAPSLIVQFQTDFSKELFGLEPAYTTGIIKLNQIEHYTHILLGAQSTLKQLYKLIQEYFPGVLKT